MSIALVGHETQELLLLSGVMMALMGLFAWVFKSFIPSLLKLNDEREKRLIKEHREDKDGILNAHKENFGRLGGSMDRQIAIMSKLIAVLYIDREMKAGRSKADAELAAEAYINNRPKR